MVRKLRVSMIALACAAAVAGTAGADDDHERARRALERGEVMPLSEVLAALEPRIDGEIVSTEFEREDGAWVYEIKYIDRGGRLVELYVDARTARVLKAEDER